MQSLDDGRRQAQPGDRQGGQRPVGGGGLDDGHGGGFSGGETDGGPGRPRRIGDGGAGIETEVRETFRQVFQQRRFAAEQVAAAADVEPQAGTAADAGVVLVHRRPGCVAAASVGQPLEGAAVGRRAGLGGVEEGGQGPGVGQGEAGNDPGGTRFPIGGGDAVAAVGGYDGGHGDGGHGDGSQGTAAQGTAAQGTTAQGTTAGLTPLSRVPLPPPVQPVGGEGRQPQ